jgi:hypothetical protein
MHTGAFTTPHRRPRWVVLVWSHPKKLKARRHYHRHFRLLSVDFPLLNDKVDTCLFYLFLRSSGPSKN